MVQRQLGLSLQASSGLVNDTNATLASGDQEASGVLGLGFPRLSQIGKAVPGGESNWFLRLGAARLIL